MLVASCVVVTAILTPVLVSTLAKRVRQRAKSAEQRDSMAPESPR